MIVHWVKISYCLLHLVAVSFHENFRMKYTINMGDNLWDFKL